MRVIKSKFTFEIIIVNNLNISTNFVTVNQVLPGSEAEIFFGRPGRRAAFVGAAGAGSTTAATGAASLGGTGATASLRAPFLGLPLPALTTTTGSGFLVSSTFDASAAGTSTGATTGVTLAGLAGLGFSSGFAGTGATRNSELCHSYYTFYFR
jgi:hypothetical protein